MMPRLVSQIITAFSRSLPVRVGVFLYYRFISRVDMGAGAYQGVPLKFAPGFRMNLMPGDSCHGSIAFSGCYELPLTRRLSHIARTEGGTLIDAGANYGYYTLLWTAARQDNAVFAFEASPRNHPALVTNLSLNAVQDRVTAHHKAVGDKAGMVHFKMSDPGQSGWDKITANSNEADWSVPLTSLDAELEFKDYTALKIDCEGYDFHVVQGALKLLEAKKIKHVFFEENIACAEKFGVSAGEISALFGRLGYRVTALGGPTEYEASLI